MEYTDICFAPVLSLEEAPTDPIMLRAAPSLRSRAWFSLLPAPRFSVTPSAIRWSPAPIAADAEAAIAQWKAVTPYPEEAFAG